MKPAALAALGLALGATFPVLRTRRMPAPVSNRKRKTKAKRKHGKRLK